MDINKQLLTVKDVEELDVVDLQAADAGGGHVSVVFAWLLCGCLLLKTFQRSSNSRGGAAGVAQRVWNSSLLGYTCAEQLACPLEGHSLRLLPCCFLLLNNSLLNNRVAATGVVTVAMAATMPTTRSPRPSPFLTCGRLRRTTGTTCPCSQPHSHTCTARVSAGGRVCWGRVDGRQQQSQPLLMPT